MTSFTTRVVLHGADAGDYDDLHEEMEKRGFTRTITGSDGIVYELPQAEYTYSGNVAGAQVHAKADAAAAAAAATKRRAVFVTESAGRTFSGLKKA